MRQIRGMGGVYQRKGTRNWWIRYSVRGVPQYESSKSTKKSDASALLIKRLQEAQWLAEAPKRMTMADALRNYVADMELRRLRSAHIQKRAAFVVGERIGPLLAKEVTTGTLKRLQKRLVDDGYAAATVNRLVTVVHSALKLAVSNDYLHAAPQTPTQLKRPKPRQGFLEEHDYLAIRAEMADWAKDLWEMFFRTGWRRNEVLWLTWREVDLDARTIRLDPDRDKTGETRLWPIRYFLDELVERRLRARVLGLPYVFHRHGKKIGMTVWRKELVRACSQSGRSSYTHDCRRTAARARRYSAHGRDEAHRPQDRGDV